MTRVATVSAAVLVAAGILSCDKSPTRPTTTTTPPTTQPAVSLQSIRIDGPTLVAPGTTAQYTATGQMSDGTTRDVSATVNWRSSNSAVLSVSAGGAASAGRAGEVVLAADSAGRRASLEILVLQPGTFRLTGFVRESGYPVADANVDLLDGSRPVLSTKSDGTGAYRLYGVAGDIEVRAAKTGYTEQVNRLKVTSNTTTDFTLTQTMRTELAGSYQLTVTASPGCSTIGSRALPAEVRVRSYPASVTQDGPRLDVTLGGGLLSGTFTGRVEPESVTFDIRGVSPSFPYYYYYYYYFGPSYDVLEAITSSSVLTISGHVDAKASSTGVSGTLTGFIAVLESPLARVPRVIASCRAQHQFVLARR